MSRKRKSYIALMRGVMYVCSGLTAALLLFLLGYVLYKGIPNISWEFLSTKPAISPSASASCRTSSTRCISFWQHW